MRAALDITTIFGGVLSLFSMNINEVIQTLESYAPLSYAGIVMTMPVCLPVMPPGSVRVFLFARCYGSSDRMKPSKKDCNLIVAHHPIIFSGLKKITGKTVWKKPSLPPSKMTLPFMPFIPTSIMFTMALANAWQTSWD